MTTLDSSHLALPDLAPVRRITRRGVRSVGAGLLLALCALVVSPSASARPQVAGRLSLTGAVYAEHEPGSISPELASPVVLAFGDLRATLDVKGVAQRLDFRLDVRLRLARQYDYEAKFQTAYAPPLALGSRGYIGGPELDLREVYLRLSTSPRTQLSLGRMLVPEADRLRLDGLRFAGRLGEHWELAGLVGGYSSPFSRSLLTDYVPPCGAGVASGSQIITPESLNGQPGVPVAAAVDPCQSSDPRLSLAFGATARYEYLGGRSGQALHGSLGLIGTLLSGPSDGGVVQRDPGVSGRPGNLLPPSDGLDVSRVYLSWMQQASLTPNLDLFSDLVVDFSGSLGAQLTRASVVASLRLLEADRLWLRGSYTYLSPLAINLFLAQWVYNRAPNGTTLGGGGIVENNLTILRTTRHEGRLNIDINLIGKLRLYSEGRLRFRDLQNGDSSPDVYQSSLYRDNQRPLSLDATLGLRDLGSLRPLRALLSYTFLADFRAQNHLLRLGLGLSARQDLLQLDFDYTGVFTSDAGADETGCQNNLQVGLGSPLAQLSQNQSLFLLDCFGRRRGSTHEVGASLAVAALSRGRLFLLGDYHVITILTDAAPTVIGHSALARIEVRF